MKSMVTKPNQPVPGNNTPADRSGEAHPMMTSGGTVESKRPPTTVIGHLAREAEKTIGQGRVRRPMAAHASSIAEIKLVSRPKKECAPGINDQLAPE